MHFWLTQLNVSTLRSEIPTAVKMSMLFFWVVTSCGLVSRCQGNTLFRNLDSTDNSARSYNPADWHGYDRSAIHINAPSHVKLHCVFKASCNVLSPEMKLIQHPTPHWFSSSHDLCTKQYLAVLTIFCGKLNFKRIVCPREIRICIKQLAVLPCAVF